MTHRRFAAFTLGLVLAGMLSSLPVFAAEKAAAPAAKVNLNAATAAQLEALPGVGPALAARIVEHRQKSGGFKSLQELMAVKGIGEKSFAKLEAHLTLGEPASRGAASK
jgi:competence protein ComEA